MENKSPQKSEVAQAIKYSICNEPEIFMSCSQEHDSSLYYETDKSTPDPDSPII
jgi:hypothetical protein